MSHTQRSLIGNAAFAVIGALALAGCATGPAPQATSASGLSAGNMHLAVHMSSSIFLQPVSPSQRVVFVEGHNTSSAQNLGFQALVNQDLMNRGYQITNDPSQAEYMVMYNVRYIGDQKADNTATGVLAGGFGAAITSAAFGGNGGTTAAYGLAGALIGGVAGHFLSQKAYMMVVDIQLEQRQAGVYTESQTSAQQGIGGSTYTRMSGVKNWMIYRDRIVAQAHGLDLAFSYATPALTHEVAGEISGLF